MDKDFSSSPAAVKAYMNLSIDESRWLYATLSSTTNQINKEALHNIEVLILVLYFFLFRQYKKTKSVTSLHAPHKNGSKYLHENYSLYPWLRWFVRSVKKIVFDWTVKFRARDRPYQRQSFWPMKDLPNQPLSPGNDRRLGEITKQSVLTDSIFHRSKLTLLTVFADCVWSLKRNGIDGVTWGRQWTSGWSSFTSGPHRELS